MWKDIFSGIREVFTQTEKTRQNTDDNKEFAVILKVSKIG